MRILNLRTCLLATFFLFTFCRVTAQSPVITSRVGFPVGVKGSVQLAYGNSKYVSLAEYNYTASLNTLYQSSTGTSWSLVVPSNLAVTQLNNIAFGAGLFVVVGNGGVIQTSSDGVAWTSRISGTTSNLSKVYFINNKFFAIGFNRTVVTSLDGITWTSIHFNTGDPADFFMSLAFGNGVYILAARNDNTHKDATIYRSTSGNSDTWSYSNNPFGVSESINRIQFLNNKFFVFNIGNRMYNSSDGNSWTDFTASVMLTNPDGTTTSWITGHQINNGVWDGAKYSFYGNSVYYHDYGSGYGSTFTSTDGTNFTLLTKTAYIVPQESNFINGRYFVCGNEGIVSSTDGIAYKHSGGSYRDMVKTAGKYVAVGMISQEGQIDNSTDFTTWISRVPAGTRELYAIAYDGGKLLAGGSQNILGSTNDGDSWTTVYNNASENFTAMGYGNGRFVVGGTHDNGDGTNNSFLRYSTDGGQTWTTANTNDNYYIKIKYINNCFFAFGYDNATSGSKILYSTDGITWSDVTPNLGFEVLYYKDVAFDGTNYHFFGVESASWTPVQFFTVSTSTPANSGSYGNKALISNVPAGVVLGGSYDEGVLDYANGRFTGAVIDVASGQDYIITSTTGNSWTALPQNSYSSITASYLSGNTVQMIGRGNAFFTVNYGAVLPVSLLRFDGRLTEGKAQLSWVTATEQNTKQFAVQHSTNGSSWKTIGTVTATGNGRQNNSYNFVHASPVRGANFYRLLMQDVDGKSAQSRVITLSLIDGKESIEAYPNPADNQLVIRTGSSLPGEIILYNSAGQGVRKAAVDSKETILNLSGLPAGIYRAEISQGQQIQRVNVVKK